MVSTTSREELAKSHQLVHRTVKRKCHKVIVLAWCTLTFTDRIVLRPIFASFTDTRLTLTVPGMVIQKG